MREMLSYTGGMFIYALVGYFVYKILDWWRTDYYDDDGLIAFLTGILWPFFLPIYLGTAVAQYVSEVVILAFAKNSDDDRKPRTRR